MRFLGIAALLAGTAALAAPARATDCPGNPGYVLSLPATVGLGQTFTTCLEAPAGSLAFVMISPEPGPYMTKFGPLCVGVPFFNVWPILVPETGAVCVDHFVACDDSYDGVTGYFQFVAVGPQVSDGSDSFNFDFTLATTPTVGASTSASYQADFLSPAPKQGWQYLWNSNGAIGNPLNYKPMQFNGTQYELDTDGTFPDSEPAAFLSLTSTGGHPGRGFSQSGALNRYTIASYTVPLAGAYDINGFIDALGSGENDLIVHVNSGAALINLTSVTGNSAFRAALGFLNAGDTIYVAAGPGATGFDFSDNFAWNFSINRVPEPATASLLMMAGVVALRRRRVA